MDKKKNLLFRYFYLKMILYFSHLFALGLPPLKPLDSDALGVHIDPRHHGGVYSTWEQNTMNNVWEKLRTIVAPENVV